MAQSVWPEWSVIQLQECFINGVGPEETAGLIGKTTQEVRDKARELGLLAKSAYEDSPPTAPSLTELFPGAPGQSRRPSPGRTDEEAQVSVDCRLLLRT